MTGRDMIRAKIASILSRILDEDDLKLSDEMVADDIDGWDSINHVKLIIAIERFYKIRFASDEITAPENVGQLVDFVEKKVAAK